MRILLVSETYPPDVNGAAYFTQRLARGLVAAGHEVHVACPSPAGPPALDAAPGHPIVHALRSLPVPLYGYVRIAPAPFAGMRQLVMRLRPDVVHVQNHFFLGRSAARAAQARGVPLIATNHFLPQHLIAHVPLGERARRELARLLWHDLTRVYRAAAVVTTPTARAASVFTQGTGLSAEPVSCGVELDRFAVGASAPELRACHGLPERQTVLCVGRLDADKHLDHVIGALARVRMRVDAQLLVVGRGKELPRLQALARRLRVESAVIFAGFVPDDRLADYYGSCDVFCNAGSAELQSIATLEAMAASKPVVLAHAVALPALVDRGLNGYTFPHGDVGAMADRLAELLLSDDGMRARFGAHSRCIVADHALEATVSAYERIYERAAERIMIADSDRAPLEVSSINPAAEAPAAAR